MIERDACPLPKGHYFYNHKYKVRSSPMKGNPRQSLDSGFHTVDFGLQVLDCGFFVRGTWILDSDR